MSKSDLKYRPRRARVPLDSTRMGPVVKLTAAVLLVAAFVLFVAFFLAPKLTELLQSGITWSATPSPTAAVTAAPKDAILDNPVLPLSFDPALGISAVIDPSVYAGKFLFATGADDTLPDRLIRLDPATGLAEEIAVTRNNDAVRMPRESGRFLVYFDQKMDGGGTVRVIDKVLETEYALCDVHFGAPKLMLEAQYLVFTERTNASEYRVNAVDLISSESVTLAVLHDDAHGVSLPSLASGQALYAVKNPISLKTSRIESVMLQSGVPFSFDPGTFVHDPKSNGDRWAWMTGNHGEDAALYLSEQGGTPYLLARGIADFYMLSKAVVYCRDEVIYAYAFSDKRTYVLSETGTKAQLLLAEGGLVLWRDVTDPEAVQLKYMKAA